MRNRFTPIILTLLLISCNKVQVPAPTIVAGKLPDKPSMEIETRVGTQEYNLTTDTEGRFQMELELSHPKYVWFSGVNKNLYLVPGDSLYITAGDPYIFSGGESGLINTYYAEVDAELESLIDTVDIKQYYGQDPLSYLSLNQRIISDFHESLDRFASENPGISKEFINMEKQNINYYWYYELNVYYDENKAYTGTAPELPTEFYDYLETVNLNDTVLFQYDGYRYFLYSWLDLQARLLTESSEGSTNGPAHDPIQGYNETNLLLNLAEHNITESMILKDVIRDVLKRQTSRMKVDEQIIDRAESLGAGDDFIEMIRKNVDVLKPLSSGNPAPEFELLDVNGETAHLQDFSGKYLVIDVWSHTCGPCLREIPRLEDLKHEMEGPMLAIITVCLSDETPWKEKMNEIGLPEDGQYRVDKGWSSQFSKDYLKFSGVPVYIIIDPDGKIVTARAPYPSKGMKEVLEGLPI